MENINSIIDRMKHQTRDEHTLWLMVLVKHDIKNIVENKETQEKTQELRNNLDTLFNHLLKSIEGKEELIEEIGLHDNNFFDNKSFEDKSDFDIEIEKYKGIDILPFEDFDDDIDFNEDLDSDDDDDENN